MNDTPSHPLFIDGPAGQLEALWSPATAAENPHCALLCHPHPSYGGSMHDSVLAIAAEALSAQKISHLRFNFRGVGGSDGSWDNGVGERDDVVAAWQWLANQAPDSIGQKWDRLILAGYSFGAATAWAARAECTRVDTLLLIAPPTQSMAFPGDAGPVPVQAIVGDSDSYCDLANLPTGASTRIIAGADHFFSGASQALGDAISQVLAQKGVTTP